MSRTPRINADVAMAMAAAYRAGKVTLESLAEPHQLTRERVRQIIREVDPTAADEAKIARLRLQVEAAEQRRDEREVQRREAEDEALRKGVRCRVCLGPNMRALSGDHYVTCSSRCARLWVLLRYHLDETAREAQKLRIARWTLAHPNHPIVTDIRLRHAARVLAGEELEWRPDFDPFSAEVRAGLAQVTQMRERWESDVA